MLILSASVGSGHMRAAQAIERAAGELYPQTEVKTVDILELANAAFRKVYGDGYLGLAETAPHLLGYLYDALDRPPSLLPLTDSTRRLVQRWSVGALPLYLQAEKPDVIINTHFLPAELVANLRRRGKLGVPQVVVTTDFEAHRIWAQSPCEHFFTASAQTAGSLRQWGVADRDITPSGIPIDPVFTRLPEREACLRAHGLRGDRPVVLQLAGGNGMGPIEEIFSGVMAVKSDLDIVVVTGRNVEARARLLRRVVTGRHRVNVLGYTDKMHELMACADLVVTKPGGLTTSEALACGVPMAVVNPIPGQESRNGDFVLENGAGIKINSLASLSDKVEHLLADKSRLSAMRDCARRLGRPWAAFTVARHAAELVWDAREKREWSRIFGMSPAPAASGAPGLAYH